MRVVIYVEGRSDVRALEVLLRPLIERRWLEGVEITLFEAPDGERKSSLLTKVPRKAISILQNDPDAVVVALPDLYPRDKGFRHQTPDELTAGMACLFEQELRKMRPERRKAGDECLGQRFKVFCFKHDLEALVLAAPDQLAHRLGVSSLKVSWRLPVEDQDHEQPPKRVVEQLFAEHRRRYRDTLDAPMILGQCDYLDIAERCPQCFKPFVQFLSELRAS